MSQVNLRGTLIATILGSSLAFLDASVVNVILPKIKVEFGEDLARVQWVIHSYGLFLSTFLLLGGALGDHFGKKRMFQIGLVIFVFASVACGLSQSFQMLLIARACQGLGAALLTPESLAILEATFSEQSRAWAIGVWSSFSAIAGAIGPPLGGLLSDAFGWRSAFLINLPLGMITWVVAYRAIPKECAETRSAQLDFFGTAVSTLGVGSLILAMTRKSLVLGVAGLLLIGLFLIIERRSKSPLLPLGAFRSQPFAFGNAITLFLYAALGSAFLFLPLYWITNEGYSSVQAGLAVLPMISSVFILSPISGKLLPKFGARPMLAMGSLLTGFGYFAIALLALPLRSYWISYFPGLVMVGIGMSIVITPLTVTVLRSLGGAMTGLASGFNNAVARLAGLVGVAFASLAMSALDSGAGHWVFIANAICCWIAMALTLFALPKHL